MKNLILAILIGLTTSMCTKSTDLHTVKMEVTSTTSNWYISYNYSVFGGEKSENQIVKATESSMTQNFNLDDEALITLDLMTSETAANDETIGVVVSIDGTIIESKTIYIKQGASPAKIYTRGITKDTAAKEAI